MTDDEILEVVRAHKEGKQIQYRCKGAPCDDWWDFGVNFHFNFGLADYRVKPEPRKPREWWLRRIRTADNWEGRFVLLDFEEDGAIKVREVIEE